MLLYSSIQAGTGINDMALSWHLESITYIGTVQDKKFASNNFQQSDSFVSFWQKKCFQCLKKGLCGEINKGRYNWYFMTQKSLFRFSGSRNAVFWQIFCKTLQTFFHLNEKPKGLSLSLSLSLWLSFSFSLSVIHTYTHSFFCKHPLPVHQSLLQFCLHHTYTHTPTQTQ